MNFKISKSSDGQFYAEIIGRNGKTIFITETQHNLKDVQELCSNHWKKMTASVGGLRAVPYSWDSIK